MDNEAPPTTNKSYQYWTRLFDHYTTFIHQEQPTVSTFRRGANCWANRDNIGCDEFRAIISLTLVVAPVCLL